MEDAPISKEPKPQKGGDSDGEKSQQEQGRQPRRRPSGSEPGRRPSERDVSEAVRPDDGPNRSLLPAELCDVLRAQNPELDISTMWRLIFRHKLQDADGRVSLAAYLAAEAEPQMAATIQSAPAATIDPICVLSDGLVHGERESVLLARLRTQNQGLSEADIGDMLKAAKEMIIKDAGCQRYAEALRHCRLQAIYAAAIESKDAKTAMAALDEIG